MRLKEARAALRELRSAVQKSKRGRGQHPNSRANLKRYGKEVPTHFNDLTGQRFGRLIACWPAGLKNGRTCWLCVCDCGNYKPVRSNSLLVNNSRSCGCLSSETSRENPRRNRFPKGNSYGVRFQKGHNAYAIPSASPLAQAYKKFNAANDMLRQFRSSLMEPAPTKAES